MKRESENGFSVKLGLASVKPEICSNCNVMLRQCLQGKNLC